MSRTVGILQSNYIPWKGYFDLLRRCDEFILYDDAQYTCNDWRNRNRIKTPDGSAWLTIPVRYSGQNPARICETQVCDPRWSIKHWKTLQQHYARTPGFAAYGERVAALYRDCADEPSLSRINHCFVRAVCDILGIATKLSWSMDYELSGDRVGRLVGLCRQARATRYLTGPAARSYLDETRFSRAGIAVEYMSYEGYPTYPQRFGAFDHAVSILDLIFNTGADAPRYLERSA